jgi:hypothetical protein
MIPDRRKKMFLLGSVSTGSGAHLASFLVDEWIKAAGA